MYQNYKVVAFVPAGRERVLACLLPHLRAQRPLIDGVMLCENTDDPTDLQYMRNEEDDFVRIVPLDNRRPPFEPKQLNTGRFYRNCIDKDTIYIRFDDDIVYIHPNAIINLLNSRLAHPEYFVIFANIWNNAIISSLQQQAGNLDFSHGTVKMNCIDNVGWKSPAFGRFLHNEFLRHYDEGSLEQLYIPDFRLVHIEQGLPRALRFSVSCFAWFGRDFAEWDGELSYQEEEHFISKWYPERVKTCNLICGDALVSHYSFFTQRAHLDSYDILPRYREIADNLLHDSYYKMLALNDQNIAPFEVIPWWKLNGENVGAKSFLIRQP